MRKPIHITAPWPTQEEIERRFPVPEDSRKELQTPMDEFKAMIAAREVAPKESVNPEKRRKSASAA
jgi:hypothetical protein